MQTYWITRANNWPVPGSGRRQLERGADLAHGLAASEHRGPGMRAEPFELIVVEDALELQRVDQRRPRCSMRPVSDLHGQAQPAIEHGGAEQALGPPFGNDVRRGLHQRGVGTIPARHHVRLRSHHRGDATCVGLERAPSLGRGELRVDRGHRTKRHTVDGDLASVDPDVDRRAGLVEACLSMDEPAAIAAARTAFDAGRLDRTRQNPLPANVQAPLDLYGAAKQALQLWCRRVAVGPQWAGAAIPLNVVALGLFDTPAAAHVLSDPDSRAAMGRRIPLRGAYPGRPEEAAAILAWCVSAENSQMTGQILFVDGGFECLARGERSQ